MCTEQMPFFYALEDKKEEITSKQELSARCSYSWLLWSKWLIYTVMSSASCG